MKRLAAFDVNASFPADQKHRAAVEAMVTQAAECAGCTVDVAKDLADEVGEAFSAGVATARPHEAVSVRVDRGTDRIEVAISSGQTVRIARAVSEPR